MRLGHRFSLTLHASFDLTESSSTQLLLAAIVAMILITVTHATLNSFRRGVHSRVLIVGSGSLVDRIATYSNLTKGVKVVGRVVDAATAEEGSLGTVNDLPSSARSSAQTASLSPSQLSCLTIQLPSSVRYPRRST